MSEIDAHEAKTHLSELLERVQKGERIGTNSALMTPLSLNLRSAAAAHVVTFDKRSTLRAAGVIAR